jgi:hypothetical protein
LARLKSFACDIQNSTAKLPITLSVKIPSRSNLTNHKKSITKRAGTGISNVIKELEISI